MNEYIEQITGKLTDKRAACDKLKDKAEVAQSQIDIKIRQLEMVKQDIEKRESEMADMDEIRQSAESKATVMDSLNARISYLIENDHWTPDMEQDQMVLNTEEYKNLVKERNNIADSLREDVAQVKRVYYGRG